MSNIAYILIFVLVLGTDDAISQQVEKTAGQDYTYYNEQKTVPFKTALTRQSVDSLLSVSWRNRNGDLRKALAAARRGLHAAVAIHYPPGIAWAHYLLGVSYQRLGSADTALKHYLTALGKENQQGNTERAGRVMNGIANLYNQQKEYAQAVEYYKKAIKKFAEVGSNRRRAITTMNLGIVYYRRRQNRKSLTFYSQALNAFTSATDDSLVRMVTYTNMGNSYMDLGQFEKAKYYLVRALAYFNHHGLIRNQSGAYLYLAELYQRQGRFQQALENARKGLNRARSIGVNQYIMQGYKKLSVIYEDRRDFRQAFRAYKQFTIIQDSLRNSQRTTKISEMQTRFNVKQKNRKIELLNKQAALKQAQLQKQKLWRIFLIIGLIALALTGGLLYRYYIQKKEANRLLAQKNGEIAYQNKELTRLNEEKNNFLGMAVHDLRNPLSGIKSATDLLKADGVTSEEVQQYVGIIGLAADRMLHLINELLDVNAIEEGQDHLEITSLDTPLIIKQSINNFDRQARQKDITIINESGKQPYFLRADEAALQRILENLISNAIKFSPAHSRVTVAARRQNNHIKLSVKDEGPGIAPKEQHKLFKRFSSLSTKPTGDEDSTGLGLYIGGFNHEVQQLTKGSVVQKATGVFGSQGFSADDG